MPETQVLKVLGAMPRSRSSAICGRDIGLLVLFDFFCYLDSLFSKIKNLWSFFLKMKLLGLFQFVCAQKTYRNLGKYVQHKWQSRQVNSYSRPAESLLHKLRKCTNLLEDKILSFIFCTKVFTDSMALINSNGIFI